MLKNAFENLATEAKQDIINDSISKIESKTYPNNAMPVEMAGFFKRLFLVFGRFSFDTTSQLRTVATGSVSISGTASTNVTTMTTGNIGIGDWGKASTAQQQSQQAFMVGIRQNFVKV